MGTANVGGSGSTPYAIQLEVLRPHNGASAGFSARGFVCSHCHDVSLTERVRPSSRPLLSPSASTPDDLERAARRLTGAIDPGGGSGPELVFEEEQTESSPVSIVFSQQFSSYPDYARWVIDQHLSLVIWPREYVVQDMHLDFQEAKIIPLRCLKCRIAGLEGFIPHDTTFPMDCFAVEGLKVFLDKICAARKE